MHDHQFQGVLPKFPLLDHSNNGRALFIGAECYATVDEQATRGLSGGFNVCRPVHPDTLDA